MTTSTEASAPKRNESDVYDRQIRLWGADAQAKMAKSKVLYIHVTGVASEVLKNLVLAGIRAVLCDNRPYPDSMLDTPCFFLSAKDRETAAAAAESPNKKAKHAHYETVAQALKPAVEELNPLLGECEIVPQNVDSLTDEFIAQFSVVVASHISMEDATRISQAVTGAGGKFFMADCFGMYGACALDLGSEHQYRQEVGKSLSDWTPLKSHVPLKAMFEMPLSDAVNRFHKKPPPIWIRYRCILEYLSQTKAWPTEEKAADFGTKTREWIQKNAPSLMDNEAVSETSLQELAKVATSELVPVCSVLGGLLGNEVIKAISGKGEPANNTLLFDGAECKAWTFLVKPKDK